MRIYVHKIKIVITCIFFIGAFFSAGFPSANPEKAIEYHNLFKAELDVVISTMWEYMKTQAHDYNDISLITNKRKNMVKQVAKSMSVVDKINTFISPENEDKIYKNAVQIYLKMLLDMLNEDYAKIVDKEKIADQSYDNMEAYLSTKGEANKKFNIIMEKLTEKEKEFAANNNLNLIYIDTDISNKLKKGNEVIEYSNDIFLIFFKSYKQELYMLDSINKADISKIEQNRLSLIKFANEGLIKIKKIKSYENDNSLKEICEKLLGFYKKEAAGEIIIINFYFAEKDRFEKIKTAFNIKKDTERSQKDINLYNKKVNALNDLAKRYNSINSDLEEERSELIESWNEIKNKFTDIHVPK